jgi:hypothetical protein
MGHFNQFATPKHSQNGEDGIVRELVRQLEITSPGYFVEFGTGNGRDMSNTLYLAEDGWTGLWIEQNQASYVEMKALADSMPGKVHGVYGTVGFGLTDNLDVFLDRVDAPEQIDVLSIDIDSYDFQVWEVLRAHHAKIVIIEINSGVALGKEQVHNEAVEPRLQGSSFTSMLKLGQAKGYRLICHTGNMIFVHESCAGKLDMPQSEIENPNSLFNDMWAKWAQ